MQNINSLLQSNFLHIIFNQRRQSNNMISASYNTKSNNSLALNKGMGSFVLKTYVVALVMRILKWAHTPYNISPLLFHDIWHEATLRAETQRYTGKIAQKIPKFHHLINRSPLLKMAKIGWKLIQYIFVGKSNFLKEFRKFQFSSIFGVSVPKMRRK